MPEIKPLRPWKGGVSLRKTVSFLLHSSPLTDGRGILKREIKEDKVKKRRKKIFEEIKKINQFLTFLDKRASEREKSTIQPYDRRTTNPAE